MAKTKTDVQEAQEGQEAHKDAIQFDCLAVTSVHVYPFKENPSMGKTRGLANVVINDQLLLRGLRIIDGANGLFVSYPNDPFYKGEDYRTIFNPITRQFKEHVEHCVLEKYQEALVK